jgi:hypothetical protein
MSIQYWETRFMPVTDTRGARIKVIQAGSKTPIYTAGFDYALGGGIEQHENAIHLAFGPAEIMNARVNVAFTTDRGYVFAVDSNVPNVDRLRRDREALTGLFVRLLNPSAAEYNALVKAMWRIDREIREVDE